MDVKKIREDMGLTQQKFADMIPVHLSSVQKWESGERNPTKSTQKVIQNMYNVHIANEPDPLYNTSGNEFNQLSDGTYDVNVKMLPFPAYASYLQTLESGKVNVEMETVTFNVDKFGRGNYMAFIVRGDSMNGGKIDDTPDGAKVLGRELQKSHWRDGFHDTKYGWIILCKQNIFHKDIIELSEDGMITCHSRNSSPEYADFKMSLNDCYQIFKVIKRIF